MVSTVRLLIALVWKCSVLRCRNYLLTLLDLVAPLFLFYFLHYLIAYLKSVQPDDKSEPQINILDNDVGGPITYYPSNNVTDDLMLKIIGTSLWRNIVGKKTHAEFELWLNNETDKHLTTKISPGVYGVLFLEVNPKEKILKYELRPIGDHIKTLDKEDGRYDLEKSPFGPPGELLGMQAQLNLGFFIMTGLTFKNRDMTIGPLTNFDEKNKVIFSFIYLTFVIAYIFLVFSITRDVIEENSTGIKEYMRVMGLTSWMIWIQWLIYTLLVHLPVSVGVTIILCVLRPYILSSNPFIIWLLIIMFTITCTMLLLILSCMFNKPNYGTSFNVSCWVILHVLAMKYLLNAYEFGTFLQVLMCLLPLINLIWALKTIESFHVSGTVWKMSHFFMIGRTGSHISIGASFIISIIEIVFLYILLVFVDGIMPGKYGVSKPISFMFGWCYRCKEDSENLTSAQVKLPDSYEPPPKGAKVGIRIRDLKKCYGTQNKIIAVDCVNLDIYEGEIMSLLGHNGAGKTTTMSMVTGMTSPTGGVVLFGGKDISKDSSFRDNLGLCPQHNMYIPKLTVIEQLVFFGLLRGITYKEAKKKGIELLNLLNIKDHTLYKVDNLSGGMKRRLCLAMALIGEPKVLVLDEPTSGLDPENRRQIWNIILGLRGQRSILITTHFMEEADVLSDRIAIMNHGNVVCCGTTMFLKRLYGTGYQLRILKDPDTSEDDITNLMEMYAPFQVVSIVPTQLTVNLHEDNVEYFPSLFEALEKKKDSLKIIGMSVTCTTMEDVFLNVSNKSTKQDAISKTFSRTKLKLSTSATNLQNMEFFDLLCQRWKVLLLKYILFRINKITELIIILVFTSFQIWFLIDNTMVKKVSLVPQPPLELSLNLYPYSYNILIHDDESKRLAYTVRDKIKEHKSEVDFLPATSNIDKYLLGLFDSDFAKFSKLMLFINITKSNIAIQYRKRYHIVPTVINLMANAVLKYSAPNDTGRIEVIIHPYVPKVPKCGDSSEFITYNWACTLTSVFIFVLAIFTALVTEERVSGFKQQQFLTGVSPFLYWFFNFLNDYSLYLFIILIYLVIVVITGGKDVLLSDWFYVLCLLFVLLGISGIYFVYLFSYLTNSVTMSYSIFLLCGLLFTFAPLFWLFRVSSFSLYFFFTCILCLNPLFPFMICVYHLSNIINTSFLCKLCNHRCEEVSKPIFTMITDEERTGLLPYIVFLALTWILYVGIILLIDYKLYRKMLLLVLHKKDNFSKPKDSDVKAEIKRVKVLKDTNDSALPLRAEWLGKTYLFGPKAVKNVSFALLPGECFGLIGVNGAGKTTTFKMLIGETFPDCGDAVIHGSSVIQNMHQYQTQVGYCPQFDTFPEYLTGEKVLMIVAQLKGIPKSSAKKEVHKWLDMMGITEHAKKKSGTYSGGTKRKLSTAMAFIGNPAVVFLDEPTTGVDPEARRKLWTVMQARQAAGQAIVLTSHSMEECEALCNRLTIMRAGQMMCLGTVEYLKNKFSQGYTVLVKLKDPTDSKVKCFKADFQNTLADYAIKDEHHTLINYHITNPQQPLSRLFAIMLNFKDKHRIVEDFSISNTTLEQLFMSFAKN